MTCNILRVRKKSSAEAGVFPKIKPVVPKNIVEQRAEKGQDLQDESQMMDLSLKVSLNYIELYITSWHTQPYNFKFGVGKIFFLM